MTIERHTTKLTEKQEELINFIEGHSNPEKALLTAMQLMIYFNEHKPDVNNTTAEQEAERFLKWRKEKEQLNNNIKEL